MKPLIGWLGRATSALLFYGPRAGQKFIGHSLGFVWFDVLRIRREQTLANIAIAFPELTRRERVRLARRCLWHLGRCLVEYSYLPFLNRENCARIFVINNDRILTEALARGRGALILTCHLGNGDLGCAALSVRGFPMTMVSKFFKAEWLNDIWFGMRERLGTQFVAPRNSSFALLKGLKRGRAVVFPLDQFTGPPIGVRTTFFGRETGTALGMAVMAQRSKAPVIPCYAWRRDDGRHVVEFLEEVATDDVTPEVLTQRFNDVLEGMVRAHPTQWMWIHRRWKKFKY